MWVKTDLLNSHKFLEENWWDRPGSNQRPGDYEPEKTGNPRLSFYNITPFFSKTDRQQDSITKISEATKTSQFRHSRRCKLPDDKHFHSGFPGHSPSIFYDMPTFLL